MKKFLNALLAVLVVFSLVACSSREVEEVEKEVEDTANEVIDEATSDVESDDWNQADTLEAAIEASGVEATFGELEDYKVVGYYYVEGGVSTVYSNEEGNLVEVRKVDVAYVASAMSDLGDSEDYTSGDTTVDGTLVSTFATESGVQLLIWTDATGEGTDVDLNYEYSVLSTNAIVEADIPTYISLVK